MCVFDLFIPPVVIVGFYSAEVCDGACSGMLMMMLPMITAEEAERDTRIVVRFVRRRRWLENQDPPPIECFFLFFSFILKRFFCARVSLFARANNKCASGCCVSDRSLRVSDGFHVG